MKSSCAAILLSLAATSALAAELTPDELLRAVDQMTPEQAYDFSNTLEAKLWKGVPEGFFTRMAVDIAVSGTAIDKLDLTGVTLSGGDLDVEDVDGFDFGILWRVFHPQFRLGLRLSAWEATDSNLGDGGYSRVDLAGGEVLLAAHCQWLRRDAWILWTELAAGSAGVSLDTIDTPAGSTTTLRTFDETFGVATALAGATWRFNPALGIELSGGYRVAESTTLEEGGRKSPVELDASGPIGRLGLAVNF